MNDRDLRALQVKMLSEDQLRFLHGVEVTGGNLVDPTGITAMCKLAAIKDHYRVTKRTTGGRHTSPRDLAQWGEQVRAAVEAFARTQRVAFDPANLTETHAFDVAVWASDLDFHFRPAPAAAKAKRTDDWASRAERP